jgi:P4 family phage/plasmid primase-like protien
MATNADAGCKPRDPIKRPGISDNVLISAGIRYSDYPEPDSIEIPYWNAQGEITCFKRWRLPNTRANGQKYHQKPDSPVYAYYAPGFFRRRPDIPFGLAANSIVLVEGEFKCLALLEAGVLAIGIPSFIVYMRDENGNRSLLRDLQVSFSREKPAAIYYIGDSDTATNFEFSRQAVFLASAAYPAKVMLPRIPIDQPKGIDDCKEALGEKFDAFFTGLIKSAIPMDRKCDATSLALLLFEREHKRIEALQDVVERERQFKRIVGMVGAAQRVGETNATARLRKLAAKVIGITETELKKAIMAEQSNAHLDGANGHQSAPPLKSVELELVERLIRNLPPIKTRGEDWFVYEDGIWTLRQRHHYEPDALEIIESKSRTEKLASAVLRHIQGKCQVKESPFCGAYKFDGNDILIAVANGVLRISPGTTGPGLESFAPDHHFTQKLAVQFDPEATCTAFSKALIQNLPDPLDRRLFGLFCASTFVPDCRWEAALCCFGETGSGKSTLFEGIESMFGKGPCQALSLTQLCDPESYNAHELEFAMLNFSTELNALELTSDRFKQLVSGETVSVRPIYRAPFYIKPTCKYAFLTNHLPRFKDGSGAELRRLRFLKFAHVPEEKDLQLKKRVAAEGSGILNLIIKIIAKLLVLGNIPQGSAMSEDSMQRFRIANDPVRSFVDTECTLTRESSENKDALKARFEKFAEHHGLSVKTTFIFFPQLYERFPVEPARPRTSDGREHRVNGIELVPVTESRL